jgi:outer membrane protein TolC
LPGQRGARQALAESEDTESQATLELQRLVLAGELRDAVWAAIAARNEAELAREREEGSRRLEGEVARRVEAGDLARSDLLLARGEALASRMARVEAEAGALQALQRYRLLTGLDRLPAAPDEIVARPADGDAHPRIRASRNALQRAGASMQVARYSLRDNPEIGVQYQRDRDEYGAPSRDTVRFGVRIPFGTEARNAPLLAAASTEIARAQAEVLQVQAATQGEVAVARAALEAAQEGRRLAVERQDSAAENLALVRKGFDLGELSLAQLLLAQTQSLEARTAFVRQTSSVGAANSRLNQALGVVP